MTAPGDRRTDRFAHARDLLTGYFLSRHWPVAWAMFLLSLLMTFANVQSFVAMVDWEKTLFDAVGARAPDRIPAIIGQFALITAAMIATNQFGTYVQAILKIRWRVWMTDDYARRYLANGGAYRIERAGLVDNPDQRIAQDVEIFTRTMIDHVLSFFHFVVAATSYTLILFRQSEPIRLSLGGRAIAIPGDFVVYAWGYALLSAIVIYHVGKPLIRRTMRLQKVEADFRFHLTDIRRGAEQIAFYRAAATEWRRLVLLFARVRDTAIAWLYAWLGMSATQSLLFAVQGVLPILAGLPRYFAGTMTLGDLMQTRGAFANLQGSLSWFTQVYPGIAETVAVVNRLHLLDQQLARGDAGSTNKGASSRSATSGGAGVARSIVTSRGGDIPLEVRDLTLTLPTGETLLSIREWRVARGERWAIQGPAGAGKTTLLRAIAGLWPHGAGTIALAASDMMIVPQRAYMPQGDLKDILAFPAARDGITDAAAIAALEACGMGMLSGALNTHRSWDRDLSPGQQQLLGFARILLRRPAILFLDEATSALDGPAAAAMYRLLAERLPGLTVVSILHDPALMPHHDHVLDVRDGLALTNSSPERGGGAPKA